MKKVVILSILLGIILGTFVSFYIPKKETSKKDITPDETAQSKLEKLGYNIDEISLILKLKVENQKHLIENPRVNYIEKLLNAKYFIEKNMIDYLYFNNSDVNKTISLVNSKANKEHYSNVQKANIEMGNFILVNKYFKLDETYEPNDLKKVTIGYGYLRQIANEALEKMSNDALKSNIKLYVTSSYRPFKTQKKLYDNYVLADGIKEADRYSARPGHSEHQTGLSLDFIVPGGTFDTFKDSEDFKWLIENAYKYGFIMRYPEGKENITGYMYESWHYRYVGEEIAKYIFENKITFDEYYAYYLEDKIEKVE